MQEVLKENKMTELIISSESRFYTPVLELIPVLEEDFKFEHQKKMKSNDLLLKCSNDDFDKFCSSIRSINMELEIKFVKNEGFRILNSSR